MKTRIKFSQIFLKNKAILRKIARSLEIKEDDIVVEIGGGHGELTQFLTSAKKLIIYEIDKNLASFLKDRFSYFENVEIKNEDFLKADLFYLKNNFKLTGNIPYKITGKIFRKILTLENHPQLLVFTLQKEVGEKILGKNKNSFWSIWIKIWGETKSLGIIKRKNFRPVPQVDSIIIKINFYPQPLIKETELFARFLKKIFEKPNQKLKNKIPLLPNEYKEKRVFDLNFDDFLILFQKIFIKNQL